MKYLTYCAEACPWLVWHEASKGLHFIQQIPIMRYWGAGQRRRQESVPKNTQWKNQSLRTWMPSWVTGVLPWSKYPLGKLKMLLMATDHSPLSPNKYLRFDCPSLYDCWNFQNVKRHHGLQAFLYLRNMFTRFSTSRNSAYHLISS